jgi:uncharacterized membrane protein
MVNKLRTAIDVLRKGRMVANPVKWKNRQIEVTAISALLLAVVHMIGAFGYELPVNEADITAISAGVIAVVNVLLTLATTEKVGLPTVGDDSPAESPKPATRNDRPAQDEHYLG